jgi:hypothetical protein
VSGQDELWLLELQTEKLEQSLGTTRQAIINLVHSPAMRVTIARTINVARVEKELNEREDKFKELYKAIQFFLKKFADRHQPAQKLHDATVYPARHRPVTDLMAKSSLVDAVPAQAHSPTQAYPPAQAQAQAHPPLHPLLLASFE